MTPEPEPAGVVEPGVLDPGKRVGPTRIGHGGGGALEEEEEVLLQVVADDRWSAEMGRQGGGMRA